MVALQTPPETVVGNAGKWVEFITGSLPNWSPQVDFWLTMLAAAMFLAPFVFSAFAHFRATKQKSAELDADMTRISIKVGRFHGNSGRAPTKRVD